MFSGLMDTTAGVPEWPYNGFDAQYDDRQLAVRAARASAIRAGWRQRRSPAKRRARNPAAEPAAPRRRRARPMTRWSARCCKPPPQRDETLQDPRCVFQIVKRHFSRYTPEMVERTTGCPQDTFLQVAETILANSGADRTTSFAYAVAWTQHTNGPQIIGCCALLQLLLGNFGRPGAGIMALRGHASIQGSTDLPTLYHSIHGYMPHPWRSRSTTRWTTTSTAETLPTGFWANMPKFVVSYLKSMYGEAATRGERIRLRLASQDLRRPLAHADVRGDGRGQGQGHALHRPEPGDVAERQARARGDAQARVARRERQLGARDRDLLEERAGGEERRGPARGHQDRSVLLSRRRRSPKRRARSPTRSACCSGTTRPPNAPGDCRTDLWFTHQLGKRLKKLYADSQAPRDQGFKNLTFDFEHEDPTRTRRSASRDARRS